MRNIHELAIFCVVLAMLLIGGDMIFAGPKKNSVETKIVNAPAPAQDARIQKLEARMDQAENWMTKQGGKMR